LSVQRRISVAAVQLGPASAVKEANVQAALALSTRAAEAGAEMVLLPELFSTPFWCVGARDPAFLNWAEPVPGPTTEALSAWARQHGVGILATLAERGAVSGEYYESTVVIDADGSLVPGTLPDGGQVACYRKNHISDYNWGGALNDEKFYFRPGSGYPVFRTQRLTLGVLICYDRWFPEAWRVLALQGAEVVFIPNASAGYVADMFVCGLRSNAAAMQVFAVACNRAGDETVAGRLTHYYGLSCVIGPDGTLLAQAREGEEDSICASLDLDAIEQTRRRLRIYRDRRPELLGLVAEVHAGERSGRMEKRHDPERV
jgi:predicted amidohydrolase